MKRHPTNKGSRCWSGRAAAPRQARTPSGPPRRRPWSRPLPPAAPGPSPGCLHTAIRARRPGQPRRSAGRPEPTGPEPGQGQRARRRHRGQRRLAARQAELAAAIEQATSAGTTSHLPLGQIRPSARQLDTERKLLTHAVRLSAYNAESALARLLRPHYARGDDESPRSCARPSPCPATSRSSATSCTSGSTPPAPPPQPRPRRPLRRTHRHQHPLPRTNLTLADSIEDHSDSA